MVKRVLKIIVILFCIVAVILLVASLYYSRDREIDFSAIMPNEITICGELIELGQPKYDALFKWLHNHQRSWKNSPASIVPDYVYSGENININVFKSGVVVNAKLENWTQVTLSGNTDEIYGKCNQDS